MLKVRVLFYADDGLLVTEKLEVAETNIRILNERSEEYSITINKDKSNVMICDMKEQPEQVWAMKVVKKIKYFCITVKTKGICLEDINL